MIDEDAIQTLQATLESIIDAILHARWETGHDWARNLEQLGRHRCDKGDQLHYTGLRAQCRDKTFREQRAEPSQEDAEVSRRATATFSRSPIPSENTMSKAPHDEPIGSEQPTVRKRWRRVLGVILVTLLAGGLTLLAMAWTPMGTAPAGARQARIERSPQWGGEGFNNFQPVYTGPLSEVLAEQLSGGSKVQVPSVPVPFERRSREDYTNAPASGLRVTWLGHSTILLEIDGARILIDPVWGERTSPLSFIGPERWYPPPLPLAELPEVDAILISHDHYDHLDYPTVMGLRDRDVPWLVPLGVGAHLEYWGVSKQRIVELDWWDQHKVGDLTLTCTPARHFSGRSMPTPGTGVTLWSGWAIAGAAHRVYYSGDTSLFNGIVEIGKRLGPFDLTMLEVGAYSASARDVHLGPEQAVLAHELLGGKVFLPVHWGLFDLNLHGWTEPIERTRRAAKARGITMFAPRPGEMIEPSAPPPISVWWPDLPWETVEEAPVWSTDVAALLEQDKGPTKPR